MDSIDKLQNINSVLKVVVLQFKLLNMPNVNIFILARPNQHAANIAASVLLLRPEILRAAILFRAMVPLVPEQVPNLSSVRVWVGAGDQDPIIPVSEAQRLAELLRHAGADVTIRFAHATHGLTDAGSKGFEPERSKNLLPLRRISLLSQRR